jgi:hypothetical protein
MAEGYQGYQSLPMGLNESRFANTSATKRKRMEQEESSKFL